MLKKADDISSFFGIEKNKSISYQFQEPFLLKSNSSRNIETYNPTNETNRLMLYSTNEFQIKYSG